MRHQRSFGIPLLPMFLCALAALFAPPRARAQADPPFKALVFSKTAGFRHDSIPAAVAAIEKLGQEHNFTVDATENATAFTDDNLAKYQVVVFALTTGDVLNDAQQAAFERFIHQGGGYAGIHSAADTEYDWAWYGQLVGAYFQSHPAIQPVDVIVADRAHPATAGLPEKWRRTDELYNYRTNPRGTVHVLATLDERSYTGGEMGFDHPIAWVHNFEGGRAFYTGLGHTTESYAEPEFLNHLLKGIQVAAGAVKADNTATVESSFQKVILESKPVDPMQLDVAPDGRVFFVERGGALKIIKPDTKTTVVAARLTVTTANEDGLLGIALDPNFAQNHWVYLYYSPPDPVENRLSRFTMNGDTLDKTTEKVLLRVAVQRDQCCHSAGGLAFGPTGDLYLSVGDNTNPFESDGFDPIDERPGRSPWDAQKSSSNTNDLRGKILRIHPEPDGTATIPEGNLFPPGAPNTRPEIYVMGDRNPFRISVDSKTGWLYWGEVGPDSGGDSDNRGPRGYDEWNQARSAGFYGWPYFVGNNYAYRDYDFETGTPGPAFDPAAPKNDSPNNTGLTDLPPARPAWIWYPYDASPDFPEVNFGGGRTAMAGPVYHYNPDLQSEVKLPAYYDNTLFIFEWSRNWLREVKMDAQGNLLKMNKFLDTMTFQRPMDMKIGPDGAIYLIEWGSGFGGGNADARIERIEYVSGTRAPVALAKASVTSGMAPLEVHFSSEGTYDPDTGDTISYAWDFDADGTTDSTDPNPTHTYTVNGNYVARLTVTDSTGKTGIVNLPISVGNSAPVVSFTRPETGSVFQWGDSVYFRVQASDAEDGAFNCSDITVQVLMGHDTHAHPLQTVNGCADSFVVNRGTSHSPSENLFLVVQAFVTDKGAPGIDPVTAKAEIVLQPKRKQAEHFDTMNGIQVETGTAGADGQSNIGYIESGDYLSFPNYNLAGIKSAMVRAATPTDGGSVEFHVDSPTGPKIGTVKVAKTDPGGGWFVYKSFTGNLTPAVGHHDLFLVFKNTAGGYLFNLDWFELNAAPVTKGDLNRDGGVAVDDVVVALRIAVGLLTPSTGDLTNGDMNGDGAIDVVDAVALLQMIVGQ